MSKYRKYKHEYYLEQAKQAEKKMKQRITAIERKYRSSFSSYDKAIARAKKDMEKYKKTKKSTIFVEKIQQIPKVITKKVIKKVKKIKEVIVKVPKLFCTAFQSVFSTVTNVTECPARSKAEIVSRHSFSAPPRKLSEK